MCEHFFIIKTFTPLLQYNLRHVKDVMFKRKKNENSEPHSCIKFIRQQTKYLNIILYQCCRWQDLSVANLKRKRRSCRDYIVFYGHLTCTKNCLRFIITTTTKYYYFSSLIQIFNKNIKTVLSFLYAYIWKLTICDRNYHEANN